jgi:hypothetical protein
MLRLCCEALDALCRYEFSTTGGRSRRSRVRDAAMRPHNTASESREQHNSGARVPKSLGDLSAQIGLEFRKQCARQSGAIARPL